jgi:hypothetical protein
MSRLFFFFRGGDSTGLESRYAWSCAQTSSLSSTKSVVSSAPESNSRDDPNMMRATSTGHAVASAWNEEAKAWRASKDHAPCVPPSGSESIGEFVDATPSCVVAALASAPL